MALKQIDPIPRTGTVQGTDYTREELDAVTAEQLANVKIKSPLRGQVFNLEDPRNPGMRSQISEEGIGINPGILQLRRKGLSMAGESLQNLRADRERTLGQGQEQFVEGRTKGLRESLAQQEQAVTERLGKTGVTGEFGKQTQEQVMQSGQQKLAQGQQLAIDEFTSMANQMDKTEGSMLKLMENIDFSAFTQDLQARGMSQDLKNQLTRLEQGRIGIDQQQKMADRAEAGNWLSLFASLF